MRVAVLEFNELSPSLMNRFIELGELPNFQRLRDLSLAAITDAEEAPPNLEPWIQWVTVHTGLPFREHRCFKLNDGSRLTAPRLWDRVSQEGGTAWVCGSMNARFDPDSFRGFFLPDPWATEVPDYPPLYFKPFLNLVGAYVREHSAGPALKPKDFLSFAQFMIRHGLSAQTVAASLRQLARERGASVKWRRAMILDRLQWDLFKSIHRSAKPDFSTFFLNSTAHFQHFHWREMEPDLFTVKPTDENRRTFATAILDGYRSMDRIVGEALALAGEDTALVLCTALSQQPMLTHEQVGGRQIFRHRDIAKLLEFAGVHGDYDYAPVMSQQFLLHFPGPAEAEAAALAIERLRLEDGRQVMWARRDGRTLDAGCMIETPQGCAPVLSSSNSPPMAFDELFYPLEALRSGMHHPDGLFWIKAPGVTPAVEDRKVPLTSVAPTLASLLGLKNTAFPGASLLGSNRPVVTAAA